MTSAKEARGATVADLARELRLAPMTIARRLAAISPIGRRHGAGRPANVYDRDEALAAVRDALRGDDDEVARDDAYSGALDFRDRRGRLIADRVAPSSWRTEWGRFVAALAEETASWPSTIADVASAIPAKAALSIEPLTPDPRGRQVLRPLLTALPDVPAVKAALRSALAAIIPPVSLEPLARPEGADEARRMQRAERSAFREARVSLRGAPKREDVEAEVQAALRSWTVSWTSWARTELTEIVASGVGTRGAIEAEATRERSLRLRALALESLDGRA